LSLLEESDHRQQLHCLIGRPLKRPLAIIERGVLEEVRAASVENAALAQNAIYKPAFFQLKHLAGNCPALIFSDRHIEKII
jgi:hypothetical protein